MLFLNLFDGEKKTPFQIEEERFRYREDMPCQGRRELHCIKLGSQGGVIPRRGIMYGRGVMSAIEVMSARRLLSGKGCCRGEERLGQELMSERGITPERKLISEKG